VPLPIPKDILPILSKDEDKQKTIAKNAEESAKAAIQAKLKSPNPAQQKIADQNGADMARAVSVATKPSGPVVATTAASKKINLGQISQIPAFNKLVPRKPSVTASAGPIAITDSAKTDLPITSPALSAAASQAAEQAKLNPKAASFVFKPTAAAFTPGKPSAVLSPATRPMQMSVS
jgi:hypothetical protein